MSTCPKCKEFTFGRVHNCPPKWRVYEEDAGEDEAKSIFASNPDNAAEKFAEMWDKGERSLCSNMDSIGVVVKLDLDNSQRTDTAEWADFPEEGQRFNVDGYYVASYYANPIEKDLRQE